nr:FlxA-like family protein [Paenibacillus apiarius]
MDVNISTVSSLGAIGSTSGQGQASSIDAQIEKLNKRKAVIAQKIVAVATGDDEQKLKEEKIKALNLEINAIDLQISQLIQKKMELEKNKNDPSKAKGATDEIGPSASDLIHPDDKQQGNHIFIDIKL